MTRRIVIEIDRLAPEPHAVTRFDPYYTASAKIVQGDEMIVMGCATRHDAKSAAELAMDNMLESVWRYAPNERFCHTTLACTLTGRCEKQFGPTGTACCE